MLNSRAFLHHLPVLLLLNAGCATTPPYSGWTVRQLYEHGQRAFEEENWGEAIRAFERLVLNFPGFERAVEARHYLARAFFADEEYLNAVAEYTRIVQVYPDDLRTPDAWFGLCRSYAAMSPHPQRDQSHTVTAHRTCLQVADDFRGIPIGDSALAVTRQMQNKLGEHAFEVGRFYFRQKIYESAEHEFRRLLESYADTEAAPRALAHLIKIYDDWGWDDDRDQARTMLLNNYPESPEAKALDPSARSDTVSVVRSRAPPGSRRAAGSLSPPQWTSVGG